MIIREKEVELQWVPCCCLEIAGWRTHTPSSTVRDIGAKLSPPLKPVYYISYFNIPISRASKVLFDKKNFHYHFYSYSGHGCGDSTDRSPVRLHGNLPKSQPCQAATATASSTPEAALSSVEVDRPSDRRWHKAPAVPRCRTKALWTTGLHHGWRQAGEDALSCICNVCNFLVKFDSYTIILAGNFSNHLASFFYSSTFKGYQRSSW